MLQHINVIVFKRRKRAGTKVSPFYICQWRDPLTGKTLRKSTKTISKSEATTIAKQLQADLNAGRKADYSTTWGEFRTRYEREIGRTKATSTFRAIQYAFNAVERHVGPRFLRMLTAEQISTLTAKLRDEDKLAEATLASILRTLKASLRWAASLDLIPKAPKITMPHKANRKSGGRAVTEEEFERMLDAIPAVLAGDVGSEPGAAPKKLRTVTPQAIASWRFLLRGLWWSGLRLREAMRLHWQDDRHITVSIGDDQGLFLIKSEANKSRKDQSFPMALEFAELLEVVPDEMREGFIFNPQTHTGYRCEFFKVSRTIAAFGKKAGVMVCRDAEGKPVFASAHDLRRSFGTRYARRVLPQVLKDLMRHTSIQTTMDFYVTQSAEESAQIAWKAAREAKSRAAVATSGASSTEQEATAFPQPLAG